MNKIIIPAAAVAMGIALVGSVSSTLAWYQYSTKAQAAFIGTSVGESENLLIKDSAGEWKTNLPSSSVNGLISNYASLNVIPITPAAAQVSTDNGNFANNSALPLKEGKPAFYNSVETGVGGFAGYGNRFADVNNYVQFDLEMKYEKINLLNDNASNLAKTVYLIDLTIVDDSPAGDLYKAVRVHFASKEDDKYALFGKDGTENAQFVTNTYGSMDTDGVDGLDKRFGYEWEEETIEAEEPIIYGINNSKQSVFNDTDELKHQLGSIPADGTLKITVTIWLEGWQELSSETANKSASWKPATYIDKHFKVGMRFQAD